MPTRKKTRSSLLEVSPGKDIPQAHLKRLIALSNAYTEQVNNQRIVYPDPDTVDFDSPEAEFEIHPQGFVTNEMAVHKRNRRGGGGRAGSGGGATAGKSKLPNPQTVLTEVKKSLTSFPYASTKGNLVYLEFNAEFGDSSKAKYFKDAYVEMFTHGHVVFLSEVDSGFVKDVANFCGYNGYCSTANTRAQAVGFLVHPRLKLIGNPVEYMQVATVQGIPDLRPAYELELEDTTTGERKKYIVLHLKSMRGGPKVTGAVRYKQLDILQKLLGPKFEGMIAGDMNFILDDPKVNDGDPLKNNGYTLVAANDHTGTQSMGSRIDGYFVKGMGTISLYQVRPYFSNPLITRAFSDHALTNVQKVLCDAAYQLVSGTPNAGCKGGLTEQDLPVSAANGGGDTVNVMSFSDDGDEKPDFAGDYEEAGPLDGVNIVVKEEAAAEAKKGDKTGK